MYVEVSVAVTYLLSHLYTKLPRRRVDNFGEELEKCLVRKLQSHWLADSQNLDASQRCFQTSGPHTDFVFAEASMASGLEWSEIQACLPPGLVLSIDPGHVACQYGSKDSPLGPSSTAWGGSHFNSSSLSSSGCSSASSVASNASSTSWPKTKHQVLYSANSRCGNSAQPTNENEPEFQPTETRKTLDEPQTHLATEAALSVLTEPEDVLSNQSTETPHSHEKPMGWNNSEALSALGDANDRQASISTQLPDGKNLSFNTSTDGTGDGNFFEQMSNDSQAKSDIENQFPFSGFQQKGGRDLDGTSEQDLHSVDFQAGGNAVPPMPPTSATSQSNFNQTAQNFVQKSTSTPSFTAASFAATKFGSTKLKSQTKRPHRLVSPCETASSGYPSQLLESVAQTPTPPNQVSNPMHLFNKTFSK